MATGGWGAAQYFETFLKATVFQPRVIIVAFYTGNNPLESFVMAYGIEHWQVFIPNPNLSKSDAPKVDTSQQSDDDWKVTFSDGVITVFTPEVRPASNDDNEVVKAGYDIMIDVANRMAAGALKTKL